MIRTHEGGAAYEHSMDHAVEFFSKAGSLFENDRRRFYSAEESALSLFQKVWIVDKVLAMKLLMWLRDCRGGAGNRSAARSIYQWLGSRNEYLMKANLIQVPELGRWDDMRAFFGTPLEDTAAAQWAAAILNEDVLAAKWADRTDRPLLQKMRHTGLLKDIGEFRRMLAAIRKNKIVEHSMCHNQWHTIKYEQVPSVAMARYTNAFQKHDEEGFEAYKAALESGEAKVHAAVLFPHDCVRTARYGQREIADGQFDALPNYMEGVDERIIVISDTSGSMSCTVAGSIAAVDVSQGMALYCSAKMPEDSPFYKKFIAFCSEGKFKDWNGMKFSQAVHNRRIFDGAVGGTRIDRALDLILETATYFNLDDSYMPTTLLIVSDMQFHGGVDSGGAEVERAIRRWEKSGYKVPKIIYWNTAGYAGQPSTAEHRNTAMVSGFSPAILKAIFGGDDLTPVGVMMRALEKYTVLE